MAELWGVELDAPDARRGRAALSAALLDPGLIHETLEILPEPARAALGALQAEGGRLPWSLFTRRYGEVREMGPAKREREQPHRDPVSPAEVLWYRALLARGFFESAAGPEEFAYIPDNLLALLPAPAVTLEAAPPVVTVPGRPAAAAEKAAVRAADDRILDDACTLLAALRQGLPAEPVAGDWPYPAATLAGLLAAAGLLDGSSLPEPEGTRDFLSADRGAALARLAAAWRRSADFDELRLIPGLQPEGKWTNDPIRAREAILSFLQPLRAGAWWSLPAFVGGIREARPDFQRPAGDYDTWFIRDTGSGAYLRGFENWDAVDGELIRFMITGPLHWLGIMDLACGAPEGPVTAFRLTPWAGPLLGATPPMGLPVEDRPVTIRSDGLLTIPRLAPREARYQISRFCVWDGVRRGDYRYHLAPASLSAAREQGLRVSHLLALLRKYAENVPPNLLRALDRWERQGVEARLAPMTVLRVRSPDLLEELRRSRAARFLGEPLGPTTIAVKAGAEEQILAILVEMGYLAEQRGES